MLKSVMEIGGFFSTCLAFTDSKIAVLYCQTCIVIHEWKGFDTGYNFFLLCFLFYALNRVHNFANIMYRLCAIQLGECLILLYILSPAHTALPITTLTPGLLCCRHRPGALDRQLGDISHVGPDILHKVASQV